MKKIASMCALLATAGCTLQQATTEDAARDESPAQLGTLQQAIGPSYRHRAAGAVQVKVGNDLQLWVVVCDETGILQHRIKAGNGTWGSWINDAVRCNGVPSVGLWQQPSGPLPIAYYRNFDNVLMETTWTSATTQVTTSLSTYSGTQFGAASTDPVVAYFNLGSSEVSVVVGRVSDGLLYSLDFYSGAWHVVPVAGGSVSAPTSAVIPWSSNHIGTRRYLMLPAPGLFSSKVYRRLATGQPYEVLANVPTPDGPIVFGGVGPNCRDGCLMKGPDATQQRLQWRAMPQGTVTKWYHDITAFNILRIPPYIRTIGDPGYAYALAGSQYDQFYRFGFMADPLEMQNALPPFPPSTDAVLVSNVYAGSRYERDAFYTSALGGGRHELYYMSYNGSRNTFEDMGMDVIWGE